MFPFGANSGSNVPSPFLFLCDLQPALGTNSAQFTFLQLWPCQCAQLTKGNTDKFGNGLTIILACFVSTTYYSPPDYFIEQKRFSYTPHVNIYLLPTSEPWQYVTFQGRMGGIFMGQKGNVTLRAWRLGWMCWKSITVLKGRNSSHYLIVLFAKSEHNPKCKQQGFVNYDKTL